MKLINKIFLLLSVSSALLACERDYDQPLLTEPEYTGPAANTTIAKIRELGADATENVPYIFTQDLVLKATVTGNDESGNIFKKLYLQDETGAIEMEVDQSSVYNYYPVGQTVYIDLNGLSISVYGGEQQLGHPDGYNYRTPWEDFTARVSKDGWGDPDNVKPIVLDDISAINADANSYRFKLVQFTNVSFENGGNNTFAPEEDYGEENITDSHGNTIMVRTSSYADFAGDYLPLGTGNVTGILGRHDGTWQLTIRTAEDVSDFVYSGSGSEGEGGEGQTETILDEPFDQENGQGSFTIEDIKLPQGSTYVWIATNYEEKYYMQASAYVNGANQDSESRLISPELDLTERGNIVLTFDHVFRNFGTDTHLNDLKLEVRERGSSNWEEVRIPNYSTGEDNVFIPSGEIDLSTYSGKVIQFAFHYKSSTENALRWQIQNVKVTATRGGSSQGSTGGNTGGTPIEPIPTNN